MTHVVKIEVSQTSKRKYATSGSSGLFSAPCYLLFTDFQPSHFQLCILTQAFVLRPSSFLWCVMRRWSKCVEMRSQCCSVCFGLQRQYGCPCWPHKQAALTSSPFSTKTPQPTVWDGRMSHLVCTWWLQWSWPSSCRGAQPAPRLWATHSVTEQQSREVPKCSKVSSVGPHVTLHSKPKLQLWLRFFESQRTSRAFSHSESLWCWRFKTTRF